ncbi:regulator of chromosome condensation RCC1 [Labilithrix luteola]|uniref:Regulator of chromosome condensation RCC1 n=1 Tax=Labilithrix luteola TaxID=1391654 RepID=A0A0K1Q3P9_9BACT|nr:regulator of chromosome condensation RCC1 [Labilithrix luteola]
MLALLLATPFGVVCCGDDSSKEGFNDSEDSGTVDTGTTSTSDAANDAAEEAATDAGPDAELQDAAPPTITCGTGTCVVDISRGSDDTCVLTKTGDVYCWGDNPCGEVGAPLDDGGGQAGFKPVPAPRKVLSGVRSISAGAASTCAILDSGELRCWGSPVSAFSETTSGGFSRACTPNDVPSAVEGVPHLVAVSSTLSNGCGVADDGELWCWGSNGNYLLGRDGYPGCSYYTKCSMASYPPAKADLLSVKVKDVIVGYGTVVVTDESGQLLSWGGSGLIGRPSSMSADPTPLPIALSNVSSVSVSLFGDGQYYGNNACAVAAGEVYCWGGYRAPPRVVPLPAEEYATQVSASFHSCARTTSGSAFCWGGNQAGQLGDGTGVDHPLLPTKVEGLKDKVAKVVASKASTCALLVNGEVQCWGANDKGQLGLGSADFLPHLQPGPVVAFQ